MGVANGAVKRGIVPLENSIGGPVKETHKALKEYQVKIVKKLTFPIRHALVAPPGASKETIKIIVSHPQALRQCRQYLLESFPNVEQQEAASTMVTYQQIQDSGDIHKAAIIPSQVAQGKETNILEDNIADSEENVTTFIVFEAAS